MRGLVSAALDLFERPRPGGEVVALHRRTSLDWTRMRPGAPELGRSWRQVETAAEWWNRELGLDYFEFRAGLAAIAWRSWGQIRGLNLVLGVDTPDLAWRLGRYAGDVLLVPSDDDDWFAPTVADELRAAYEPGVDIYFWDDAVYGIDFDAWEAASPEAVLRVLGKRGPGERLDPKHRIRTNNYALSSRFLRSLPRPNRAPLLRDHVAVDEAMRRARGKHIPTILSVTNKSLASITQLRRVKEPEELRALAEALPRGEPRLDDRVGDWALPLVSSMDELYRRLALLRSREGDMLRVAGGPGFSPSDQSRTT
jgi:hypothetical protein